MIISIYIILFISIVLWKIFIQRIHTHKHTDINAKRNKKGYPVSDRIRCRTSAEIIKLWQQKL